VKGFAEIEKRREEVVEGCW